MPLPRTVHCDICHQQFSAHSLPIHVKACAKKHAESTTPCPSCGAPVDNSELNSHLIDCRKTVAALKANGISVAAPAVPTDAAARIAAAAAAAEPAETRLSRRIASAGKCDSCGALPGALACVSCNAIYCSTCCKSVHSVVSGIATHCPFEPGAAALAKLASTPLEPEVANRASSPGAGMMECAVCKRHFNANRLAKHQLICATVASKPGRKAFPSASEERMEGTEFKKYFVKAAAKEAAAAVAKGAALQRELPPRAQTAPAVDTSVTSSVSAASAAPSGEPVSLAAAAAGVDGGDSGWTESFTKKKKKGKSGGGCRLKVGDAVTVALEGGKSVVG